MVSKCNIKFPKRRMTHNRPSSKVSPFELGRHRKIKLGFHRQKCENQLGGPLKSHFDGQLVARGQKAFCSATSCPPTRLGYVTRLQINKSRFGRALPRILGKVESRPASSTPRTFLCVGFWRARSRDNPTTRCRMFEGHRRSRRSQFRTSTVLNDLKAPIDCFINSVWW